MHETELPLRWSLRIAKIPNNNEEANDPKFKEEVFTVLNDMDMLILEQNEIMSDVLQDSLFEDELDSIRKQVVKETFGDGKSRGYKE